MFNFLQNPSLQKIVISQCRLLSSSGRILAGGKFRQRRGEPADALAYGPLTDLPDWTYVDNKPTVMTKRQMKRQMKRVKIGAEICKLLKEIDEQKVESRYGLLDEQHRDY